MSPTSTLRGVIGSSGSRGKGGKRATVPLAPRTAEALDHYLLGREDGPLLTHVKLSGNGDSLTHLKMSGNEAPSARRGLQDGRRR